MCISFVILSVILPGRMLSHPCVEQIIVMNELSHFGDTQLDPAAVGVSLDTSWLLGLIIWLF